MGYDITFNCLLSVPPEALDLAQLEVGKQYILTKGGERLYPLNIPIEICDSEHRYYGKVAVRTLTLESGKTQLTFEVLKVFSPEEAAVYTSNFIKP